MNPPAGAISLAQAARLSGYHQDYLGQLCRAGKLQATKMGRTWFTTERSVRDFLSSLQGDARFDFFEPEQEPRQEEEVKVQPLSKPTFDSAGPQIAENYLISEVVGLPIALKERPQVAQLTRIASLDGVITKVRLQQVQRDLADLAEAVEELAMQVETNNLQIQQLATVGTAATIKHSYVPSLEVAFATAPQIEQISYSEPTHEASKFFGRLFIVTGSALLVAAIILLASSSAWQTKFFGDASPVTTLYQRISKPQVAGDTVIVPTALDQGSATVTNSNSNINKVPPAPSTPGETLGGIGAGNLLQ